MSKDSCLAPLRPAERKSLQNSEKNAELPYFTEETLSTLERAEGSVAKAAAILKKSRQTIYYRLERIRKVATKIGHQPTLDRLAEIERIAKLPKLPSFTEATLKALEEADGSPTKASRKLKGITPQGVSTRKRRIREVATKIGHQPTLDRLAEIERIAKLPKLPSFTEATLKALEEADGSPTKAAEILGLNSPAAVSVRRARIKEAAKKIGDKDTLTRLDKYPTRTYSSTSRRTADADGGGGGPGSEGVARRAERRPGGQKEKGTPAALLYYMFGYRNGTANQAPPIDENNAKMLKDMARQRGGNDSLTNIYRELAPLESIGLVRGGKGKPRFIPDWVLELNPEEILGVNPELLRPNLHTDEEAIREVRIRVERMAIIQSLYGKKEAWIAARERFKEDISVNAQLVQDLAQLGYSVEDAIDGIFSQKTETVHRGFGVDTMWTIIEPQVVHQRLLIEADFESLIRDRLSQRDMDRNFVIYGLGIGKEPKEAEDIIRSFYDALKKLNEDASVWNVRFIGFDVDSKVISDAEQSFEPFNKREIGAMVAMLGVENANVRVEFHHANVYDAIELRNAVREANLEDVEGDYILARYLNYENSQIRHGKYDVNLTYTPGNKEVALTRLAPILHAYLTYRNALLILGRPQKPGAPGTRYVIDPNEFSVANSKVLIPPGTDFIGFEALGVLEYEDEDAVRDTGLIAFKESVRLTPGVDEIEMVVEETTEGNRYIVKGRGKNPYNLVLQDDWLDSAGTGARLRQPESGSGEAGFGATERSDIPSERSESRGGGQDEGGGGRDHGKPGQRLSGSRLGNDGAELGISPRRVARRRTEGPGSERRGSSASKEGRVTYVASSHYTANDFERHCKVFEEVKREAEAAGQEFVLVMDFVGPAWPKRLGTADETIDYAKENPETMRSLREYFDKELMKINRMHQEATQGKVRRRKVDFTTASLRWIAKTGAEAILEDVDFENWLASIWAFARLKKAEQLFILTGLATEEEQDLYIDIVDEVVTVLKDWIRVREERIVNQITKEVEHGRAVGVMYGAGHFGIFESLQLKGLNVIKGSSSVEREYNASYSRVEGIASRLAIGETIAREEIELNYFQHLVAVRLRDLARRRDRTDSAQIHKLAGEAAGRWTIPEILELGKAMVSPVETATGDRVKLHLKQWLQKNGTTEEQRFFGITPALQVAVKERPAQVRLSFELIRDMLPDGPYKVTTARAIYDEINGNTFSSEGEAEQAVREAYNRIKGGSGAAGASGGGAGPVVARRMRPMRSTLPDGPNVLMGSAGHERRTSQGSPQGVARRRPEGPERRGRPSGRAEEIGAGSTVKAQPANLEDRLRRLAEISPHGMPKDVRRALRALSSQEDSLTSITRDMAIKLLLRGRPLIAPQPYKLTNVETPWGRIDLTRLNDFTRYEGQYAVAELARDLEIAHYLGLIHLSNMQQGISPQTLYHSLKKYVPSSTLKIEVGWITWANILNDANKLATEGMWTSVDGETTITYKGEAGRPIFTVNGKPVDDPDEVQIAFLLAHPDVTHLGSAFRSIPSNLRNTKSFKGRFRWSHLGLNCQLVVTLRNDANALASEGHWTSIDGETTITYREESGKPIFTVNGKPVDDPDEVQIAFLLAHPDVTHLGSAFTSIPSHLKNTVTSKGKFRWSVLDLNRDLVIALRQNINTLATKGIWTSTDGETTITYKEEAGKPVFTVNGELVDDPDEAQIAFLLAHPDVTYLGSAFTSIPSHLKNTVTSKGKFRWSMLGLNCQLVVTLRNDANALASEGHWTSIDGETTITYREESGKPIFTVNGELVDDPDEAQIAFLLAHPDVIHFGNAFRVMPSHLKNTVTSKGKFRWSMLGLNCQLVVTLRNDANALASEGHWTSIDGETTITYREESGKPIFTVNGELVDDPDEAQIAFLLAHPDVIHFGNAFRSIPSNLKTSKGKFRWSKLELSRGDIFVADADGGGGGRDGVARRRPEGPGPERRGSFSVATTPERSAAEQLSEQKCKGLSRAIIRQLKLKRDGYRTSYGEDFTYGGIPCETERWTVSRNYKRKFAFARIGHLFFIEQEEYGKLSPRLKNALGANAILLTADETKDDVILGIYTVVTIVVMINSDIAGKRVIDAGAGDGILSLVALKLGASSVDLIEIDEKKLPKVEMQLQLNGYVRNRDYRLYHADLKNASDIAQRIPETEEETAIVSNIGGDWSNYDVTNIESIALIDAIPNVTLFIGGGYQEWPEAGLEKMPGHQDLSRKFGFNVNPEMALFKKVWIGMRDANAVVEEILYPAWSATRSQARTADADGGGGGRDIRHGRPGQRLSSSRWGNDGAEFGIPPERVARRRPEGNGPEQRGSSSGADVQEIQEQKEKIREDYLQTKNGIKASLQITEMVTSLIKKAIKDFKQKHPNIGKFAFVLIGSSGRQEMCFKSDVDCMIVHDGTISNETLATLQKEIDETLQSYGFNKTSTFAIATINYIIKLGRFSLIDRLALDDMRFVAGDEGIFSELSSRTEEEFGIESGREDIAETMLNLIFIYRRYYRDPDYNSENPNIKKGLGGVREVQFLTQAAKINYGIRAQHITEIVEGLAQKGVLTSEDTARLIDAFNFVLAVRSEMHWIAGGEKDELIDELKERLATNFGFSDGQEFKDRLREKQKVIRDVASSMKGRIRKEIDDYRGRDWLEKFERAYNPEETEEEHVRLAQDEDDSIKLAIAWRTKFSSALQAVMDTCEQKGNYNWNVMFALAHSNYTPDEVFIKLLSLRERGPGYRVIPSEVVRNESVPISILKAVREENGFERHLLKAAQETIAIVKARQLADAGEMGAAGASGEGKGRVARRMRPMRSTLPDGPNVLMGSAGHERRTSQGSPQGVARRRQDSDGPERRGSSSGDAAEAKHYEGPVIVIGGSTYGWFALWKIIEKLPPSHPPIIVTQHLPADDDLSEEVGAFEDFNKFILGSLRNIIISTKHKGEEPSEFLLENNMILIGDHIEIAKDDRGNPLARIYQFLDFHSKWEEWDRYATSDDYTIDVLFKTAADHFEENVIAVVISGEENDGTNGAKIIQKKGGKVIVQKISQVDEMEGYECEMPNSVIESGISCEAVPIQGMADAIMQAAEEAGYVPAVDKKITPPDKSADISL